MKTLVTIGDSFTYGEELEDVNNAWPKKLGDRIGYQVTNLGQPSASNDNIVRKTLDAVAMAPEKPDLVVVAWSNISRSEHADEFGYYDVWPGYQGKLFERNASHWRNDLVDYVSKYHSADAIHRKWMQQVVLLQSFLKQANVNYIMLSILQNEYYKNKHFNGRNFYRALVDKERFIGFDDSGMMEWTYGCPQGPGGHFLEQGHQIVADRIYEHIGNLGWVS
jgi:hypothetical protein